MNEDDPEYEKIIEDLAASNGISVEEAASEMKSYLKFVRDKVNTEVLKEHQQRVFKRDKRKNKVEFNVMAKKRRSKAKFDAKGRKANRKRK
jgi:predicted RNA-binding protein Jag